MKEEHEKGHHTLRRCVISSRWLAVTHDLGVGEGGRHRHSHHLYQGFIVALLCWLQQTDYLVSPKLAGEQRHQR